MDILEFIGGLEALSKKYIKLTRDKTALATSFGLETLPSSLPYDVEQTRIPNRALDGYITKHILSDPKIAQESFADFAFTASCIFAAQQVAMRSGYITRMLDLEYPCFIFRSLDPCIMRIMLALHNLPLVIDWWSRGTSTAEQDKIRDDLLGLFASRINKANPIEQIVQTFSCSEDRSEIKEEQITLFETKSISPRGKIGLLTMSKLGTVDDYILAFNHFKSNLSEVAVVVIYDKRFVIDQCVSTLIHLNSWRGIALKHLSYSENVDRNDYALVALKTNFIDNRSCDLAHNLS